MIAIVGVQGKNISTAGSHSFLNTCILAGNKVIPGYYGKDREKGRVADTDPARITFYLPGVYSARDIQKGKRSKPF